MELNKELIQKRFEDIRESLARLERIRALSKKESALAAYRQALEWKPGDEGIEAKIRALEER